MSLVSAGSISLDRSLTAKHHTECSLSYLYLERVGNKDDRAAALNYILHVVKLHVIVQHQLGGVQSTVQPVVTSHSQTISLLRKSKPNILDHGTKIRERIPRLFAVV
jgi:hypothetical protein